MLQVRKILTFVILNFVGVLLVNFSPLYANLESSEVIPFEHIGDTSFVSISHEGWADNFELSLSEQKYISLLVFDDLVMLDINTSEEGETNIKFENLEPERKYYLSIDDLTLTQEIIVSASGVIEFNISNFVPHVIYLQKSKSTKNITSTGGDCNTIGSWDVATKTCTLNRDVFETIQVSGVGVILDGNNHLVSRTTSGNIGVSAGTGVTIKNLSIQGFTANIQVSGLDSYFENIDLISTRSIHVNITSGSRNNIFSNLTLLPGFRGFQIIGLENKIENSTFTGLTQGIYISGNSAKNNIISKNILEGNSNLVNITNFSTGNIIYGNTFKPTGFHAIEFSNAPNSLTQIYNNNFYKGAFELIDPDDGPNIYSHPLPIGGNYWSDYDETNEGCTDVDRNNVCDTPRAIHNNPAAPGYTNDMFPWKIPDGWLSVVPEPARDPVIIIPGITGSYLFKDYGDDGEIWPSVTKLITSITDEFLNDLSLNMDGSENSAFPIRVGDIIREEAGAHVFDGLIEELISEGYEEGTDLFVLPYDWRKSNSDNAVLLKNKINEILEDSGSEKADIIAHSMGGILSKQYIADEGSDKIDQLIFLGTPHLGAPKAYKALMYGDDMGYKKLFLGLKPERLKIITQNMPAVYELLPSQEYINKVGGYIRNVMDESNPITLDYAQTKNKMIADGRNPLMFPFTENIHNSLDNLDLSGIEVHNFVGCGGKTVGEIDFKEKLSWIQSHFELADDFDLMYVNGDETVPLVSADATPNATMHYVQGISHGTMPSAVGVKESIIAILGGEDLPNLSNILESAEGCSISGKNVSVHSPVELHIYDEDGNHAGPNANGDIEINISAVEYDVINDVKFVFLPDGKNFKIITKATNTGGYDLIIKDQSSSDEVTATYEWKLIPLTSLDTKGEINIGPSYPSSQYVLKTDSNGDGVFEKNIGANQEVSIKDYLQILRTIVSGLNVDSITKNLLIVKIDKVEKELDKGKYEQVSDKLAKLGEKLYAYRGKFQTLLTQERNDLVNSINLLLDELLKV